jgi:MFS family permease
MIMTSLGLATNTEIGIVTMIASFIYGVGALVGGPLGDKIGEAKTIAICLGFSGLSTLIMIAAGMTSNIYVYAVALISMAVWGSFYHATANSLISKSFKGRVSEAMGLHGVGGTLGTVLTPTVAWFIGASFGWPWAFVAFGMLCVVFASFFLRGRFAGSEGRTASGGSIIDVLKIRELWILLIFNVAIGLFMKGVEFYFPTYVQKNKLIGLGLTEDERGMWASIAFTLVLAVGVPAQWIGGKAADKFGSKRVLIATSTGVCLSLLSILFFPFPLIGIALFIVLYGLSFYAHQPALNALTGFCCPENQRGSVYGMFFFTSFGIGSVSQFIAGYVADNYGGYNASFLLLMAFAFAAFLLAFKLPRRRENG